MLEVFAQNAERIQKVVLDLIGRFPADLDALGARAALEHTRGDGHAIVARGHPPVRDGALGVVGDAPDQALPDRRHAIRAIRAEPVWWLESARRLDAAGYAGLWCWDHFMGQGDLTVPVVECWTILAMAAAATDAGDGRAVRRERHEPPPGGPRPDGVDAPDRERRSADPRDRDRWRAAEHAAYGIPFPEAPERVRPSRRRSRSIRALWTGGPVTRASAFYPLEDARAFPIPDPRRRSSSAARHRGARLAGRIGDGWSAFDENFEANLPLYLEALEASGGGARTSWSCRVPGRLARRRPLADSDWSASPRSPGALGEAGADGAIVLARTTDDVDALVEAAGRW